MSDGSLSLQRTVDWPTMAAQIAQYLEKREFGADAVAYAIDRYQPIWEETHHGASGFSAESAEDLVQMKVLLERHQRDLVRLLPELWVAFAQVYEYAGDDAPEAA